MRRGRPTDHQHQNQQRAGRTHFSPSSAAMRPGECQAPFSVKSWGPARSVLLLNGEGKVIANKGRESQPSTLAACSLDAPAGSVTHDLHLASLTPPAIHLTGQSNPHSSLFAHLSEMLQESLVGCSRPLLDDVVGMDNEAGKAVCPCNKAELLLP